MSKWGGHVETFFRNTDPISIPFVIRGEKACSRGFPMKTAKDEDIMGSVSTRRVFL